MSIEHHMARDGAGAAYLRPLGTPSFSRTSGRFKYLSSALKSAGRKAKKVWYSKTCGGALDGCRCLACAMRRYLKGAMRQTRLGSGKLTIAQLADTLLADLQTMPFRLNSDANQQLFTQYNICRGHMQGADRDSTSVLKQKCTHIIDVDIVCERNHRGKL